MSFFSAVLDYSSVVVFAVLKINLRFDQFLLALLSLMRKFHKFAISSL